MGLKSMWGVDDPAAGTAGDCPQGKKFTAAFKASLANSNRSLQYTAAHTEAGLHKALAADRDSLLKQFRSTLPTIDAANASKADKRIDDVLNAIGKLEAAAAALKQETEAAEADWAAQEGDFATATARLDELADWGDPDSDKLRLDATTTQNLADQRQYRDAVSGNDALQTALDPMYAAYEKQRAAKTRYDTDLAALEPRLAEVQQSSFASVVEGQQAIDRVRTSMTEAADAKDYVLALSVLGELEIQAGAGLVARDALQGKKDAYETARAVFEPRLPKVNQGGGAALTAQQDTIDSTVAEMTTAAESEDFDTASRLAGELDPMLGAFETLMSQREDYEARLAELQPLLPTATEAGAGKLAEGQDAIATLVAASEAAATEGDYLTATQKLDELAPLLDELSAVLDARARFDEALAAVDPRIPTATEPGKGRLDTVQREIADLNGQMQTAQAASDYEAAMSRLDDLTPKLAEFEELLEQRRRYDDAWATLVLQLPTSSVEGSPKVADLERTLSEQRQKAEATAAGGDYAGALAHADALRGTLGELQAEQAAYEKQKDAYGSRIGAMKQSLDGVLKNCPDAKEVKSAQDKVGTDKAAADAADAAGDYVSASARLDDLDKSLKAYEDEARKTPRDCFWVLAVAARLQGRIQSKYLDASDTISDAAQAYDDALAAHRKTLKEIRDAEQLADEIVLGLFFAGLGGAVGGAVGNVVKTKIGEQLAKKTAGAAIIDATKDVGKFTTRMINDLGGSAGDPGAGLPEFGGSGVELARKLGKVINAEGRKLLAEVDKLEKLVQDNSGQCKEGALRVEGDPTEALDNDPFLKVLGGIVSADRKAFAKLLWGQWITEHAYSVKIVCSKAGCSARVEDNVEDGWAWWNDLTDRIVEQSGDDFGLRERLRTARATVARQAARNRFNL